jgi:hypothetical protein
MEELRELNERVGREVMKSAPRLTWEIFNEDESATMIGFDREAAAIKWWDEHPSVHADRHIGTLEHWPFYSTDMNAAMEVAEKMRERGFRWDARTPRGTGWRVRCFPVDGTPDGAQEFRGLLPEILCRAALAAIEG